MDEADNAKNAKTKIEIKIRIFCRCCKNKVFEVVESISDGLSPNVDGEYVDFINVFRLLNIDYAVQKKKLKKSTFFVVIVVVVELLF